MSDDAPTRDAPGVLIRPARHADVADILALWATAYAAAPDAADDRASVNRLIEAGNGSLLLVAEHSGRVIGTVIAAWDGWRGNLYRLAVAPDHRRKGVGRRLLHVAEDHLLGQGARRFSALVCRRNAAAVALWSTVGYHDEVSTGRFVKQL